MIAPFTRLALTLFAAALLAACGFGAVAVPPATPLPTAVPTDAPAPQPTAAPTSAPEPTAVPTAAPAANLNELTYVSQGGVYALPAAGGQPRRLADAPADALAVTLAGDALLVLRERSLERVPLSGGAARRVATLEGSIRFGVLVPAADGTTVFYAGRTDGNDARLFGETFVGRYSVGDGTATPLLTIGNGAEPLGLSASGTELLLLPRGQDPAFGGIQVVDLAGGTVVRTLTVEGEGNAALSPDGRYVITTVNIESAEGSAPPSGGLRLYDLTSAKPEAFTPLDPPRPAGVVRNVIWAPDGTGFYVAAGKGNIYELSESYGIWRYDLASGKPTQVSDANVVAYSYIDGISPDGAMLLLRNPQGGAMLVSTADGYATPIELAAEARVAGWRARAQ